MGKREYFPAYFSYRRTLKLLNDTQLGRVFMAALIYAEEGIEPDLEPLEMMGFGFIKEDIDRANENYEELCEKRKASGSKGGLAKANNSKSHKEKQTEEDEIFATENLANLAIARNEEQEKHLLENSSKPSDSKSESKSKSDSESNTIYAPDGAGDKADSVPYIKIKEHFNTLCPSIGQIRAIEGRRRIQVAARWKDHPSLNEFDELFKTAEASDFLTGKSSDWKATFDWLMIAGNWNKTVEGNYTNKTPKKKEFEQSSFDTDEYMLSALKRTYGSEQEETEEDNG